MTRPKTTPYSRVHINLIKQRGKASDHVCDCGQPAKDWAYQHNGDPEIYDVESGRPFSEDLERCYKAMCRSCHFKLDATDLHKKLGQALGRSNVVRAQMDEEFATKVSEDRANAARQANRIKRTCTPCGLTSHPAAIGAHQKGSGHVGYTDERETKE